MIYHHDWLFFGDCYSGLLSLKDTHDGKCTHTLVSRMSRFELEPNAPTALALTVALVVMNGAGVDAADAADEADAPDGAVNMALDDGENGKLEPKSGYAAGPLPLPFGPFPFPPICDAD